MPGADHRTPRAWGAKTLILCTGLLFVILAVLFRGNFQPGMVAFSNDSPLGQTVPDQMLMPKVFFGQWLDLNSIGSNAGAATPNISNLIKLLWEGTLKSPLGPLGFANTYTPLALFILGFGALMFFRQLRFTPPAAFLGALALMLNSTLFGGACWGIASLEVATGFNFFALALVLANRAETPWFIRWTRLALAGLCVGINVMESADIGALASILVALFVFFKAFADETGPAPALAMRGVLRVVIVAGFAGFIALQSVLVLVGVAITGVAGTAQDTATKSAHWDFATQWSLPKMETLALVVPGLFGYKMDTPSQMPDDLQDAYRGGLYWGGMGRDPANDRFLDSGAPGQPPNPEWMRQTGSANYCGVLVALIGAWTISQAFRRKGSVFSPVEKRWIWFWSAILLGSLLLAWGRFAPFYAILYQLPYFSTIRNPTKFIIFLGWALVILFAYGMNALSRRQLDPQAKPGSVAVWWRQAGPFEHKWAMAGAALFAASLAGWLLYSSEKPALVAYLEKVGFTDDVLAGQIAGYSISAAGWFVVLLGIALALATLLLAGAFNGPRARLGLGLLTAFLLFDFIRADLPYIIQWDYVKKYEVGSLNPVETFLRQAPYEHRVAVLPFDAQAQLRSYDNNFGGMGVYRIEWSQHHFPYYNIQSLDIIQMPRMPEDLKAYLGALSPHAMDQVRLDGRLWQLTNTRYLLGAAGFLDVLNSQLDPVQHRFRVAQRFDLVAKPGIAHPAGLEDLTAVTNADGDLALFDFTGALPRAKVYSSWQVQTNDQAALTTLAAPDFHPSQTVLVATPPPGWPAQATNANDGTVTFQSYAPDDVVLQATARAPSILLLNDHYDPLWRVTVDGRPASLLRCNFIMRGVCLPPGQHTVAFRFRMPMGPLAITSSALGLGVLLAGLLAGYQWFLSRRPAR